jgi:hypothetical protein
MAWFVQEFSINEKWGISALIVPLTFLAADTILCVLNSAARPALLSRRGWET